MIRFSTSQAAATPSSRQRLECSWHATCVALSAALALAGCRRFDACGSDALPCDVRDARPSPPVSAPPGGGELPALQYNPRVPRPLDGGDAGAAPTAADVSERAPPSLVDGHALPPRDVTGAAALPPGDSDDDDSDDAVGNDDAPDAAVGLHATPPRLEAMSPPDGAAAITSERVSLRFSEAMDASSIEAAFPTGDGFTWSDGGSSVEFHLPLPFGEAPELHVIVVPASVRDAAGTPLGADVEAHITLAALARATLPLDFSLTGNQLQGSGSGSFLQLGDAAGGGIYHGAASFSLADLPRFEQSLGLRRASLQLQICGVAGDPGGALGGVEVARVGFAARAAIDQPIVIDPVGTLLEPGPVSPGQLVELDVAAPLAAAWSEGQALLQLRFAPRTSNFNGVSDLIYLRRVVDENNAVISGGVLDPDPDTVARIEVEYFH